MRKIAYNSQLNNITFGGRFPHWLQSFSTVAWMFMSYYSTQIKGDDDSMLSKYILDIEASLGNPGIGRAMARKFSFITGHTSLWWEVQQQAISDYLHHFGIKGSCLYHAYYLIETLPEILKQGPVIISAFKMGSFHREHPILIIEDHDLSEQYVCHDSEGNALTKYKDEDGSYVFYPKDWLNPRIEIRKEYCRLIRWVK